MPSKNMAEAVERAKIKLVIFDVHGVLTDNTYYTTKRNKKPHFLP